MKKRLLSALLAICVLLTLIPAAAFGAEIIAGGYCGAYRDDDLEWELDSEGTLTIRATWRNVTGATPMQNCSEEGGPWCVYADSIRNVVVEDGVFDIADNAFCGCTQMQSLTMSDDVVFLGYAFAGCTGLQTVTIGRGVKFLNSALFENCTGLQSVTIPDSVTEILNYAFRGCSSLQSVTIPEGVTTIDSGVFEGCSSLQSVTIPEGVTTIDSSAFYGCSSLQSVTIPESVTTIGRYAFSECSSLQTVIIPESITTINSGVFSGCSGLQTLPVREGMTSIGSWAFSGCSSLQSATIPESVTTIGEHAFYMCSSLQSVTIPESITAINSGVFSGCSGLRTLPVREGMTSIGDSAFSGCSSLQSATIPESVTTIGGYAFSGCSSLQTVTIPEGVTTIGGYAFYKCSSLQSVTIPGGITAISDDMFCGCSSLSSVTIPESVTTIGDQAFRECSSLETVIIPDSVTSIGKWAFWECTGLRSVTIPGNVHTIEDDTFYDCSSLETVIIPEGVTSIGKEAFLLCEELRSVMIPASVHAIGKSAFSGCYELDYIYYGGTENQWKRISIDPGSIPAGTVIIYGAALMADIRGTCGEDADNLTWSVDRSGTLTISGTGDMADHFLTGGPWWKQAFFIKKLVVEEGVTSIGSNAFRLCTRIKDVTLPDSVTRIGKNAFLDCAGLSTITFGEGLRQVEDGAFAGCSGLRVLYFTGSAPRSWSGKAFGEKAPAGLSTVYCREGAKAWPGAGEKWNGLTVRPVSAMVRGPGQLNKTRELLFPCDFDTDWFKGSSYEYCHPLALASMVTTLATYNKENGESAQTRTNYADADANLKSLYEQLGFTNYGQYGYHTKPTLDSIACGMATRQLRDEKGAYTLVAVGIRSGAYEREWGSDFTIGNSDQFHAGFLDAARKVQDALNTYLKENVSGRVKFWITGYSRGAATADVLAYSLDNGSDIPGVTWKAEDVFAYCFEVPQACMDTNILKDPLYNNIFCIVNPVDLVPKVAPYVNGSTEYRYKNIGTVLKVPYKFNTSDGKNYSEWEKKMLANWEYIASMESADNAPYTIDRGSTEGQAWALDYLVTQLFTYGLPDKAALVEEIEPSARALCYEAVELLDKKLILKLGSDLMNAVEKTADTRRFKAEIALVVTGSLPTTALSGYAAYASMRASIADVIHTDIPGISEATAKALCDNITAIAIRLLLHDGAHTVLKYLDDFKSLPMGHYPELCLAWMMTLDGIEDYTVRRCTEGRYNCPVDVYVYNSSGELEAAIVGDEVQQVPGGEVLAYIDENGQKCFVYPTYDTYSVEVKATGDGEFTCTYFTSEDDQQESIVSYQSITITAGEELTGTVSEADGATMANLEPTAIFTGEEIRRYQVTVSTTGHGTASGGGDCLVGEFIRVTAEADPGEEFLGWYVDGQLVSTDAEYRFQVLADTAPVAKFSTNEPDFRIIPEGVYRHPGTVEIDLRILNYLAPEDTGTCCMEIVDADGATIYSEAFSAGELLTRTIRYTLPVNGEAAAADFYYDGTRIASADAETVPLEAITLSSTEAEIFTGSSLALSAEASPLTAYDPAVTWSSSDESVAVVDENGSITGVGCGDAVITATSAADPAISAQCTVTVSALYTELSLDRSSLSMIAGETLRLEGTLVCDDEAGDGAGEILWTSSDPAVAAVTADGTVQAVGAGTTMVQAASPDGALSAFCCVSVRSYLSLRADGMDSAFAAYLQSEVGSDPEGRIIPETVTELHCAGRGIRALTGVEKMLCLETLDCSGNDLTTLDLSRCTSLQEVDCSDNESLTTLILPRTGVLVHCDNTGLENVTYAGKEAGCNVSGTFCAAENTLVQLRDAQTDAVVYQLITDGTAYRLWNVAPGAYRLRLSAAGRVTRTLPLEVGTEALTVPQVTLAASGDLNGMPDSLGREVSIEDLQCLYEYLSTGVQTGQITNADYFTAVADCNGDGNVNILDYQALYQRVCSGHHGGTSVVVESSRTGAPAAEA